LANLIKAFLLTLPNHFVGRVLTMPVFLVKLFDRHRFFYSPCHFHFVGRVRPSGCPTDIKNFLIMPVFLAKLLDRHENFFYIIPI